jgi:hypothetical protein
VHVGERIFRPFGFTGYRERPRIQAGRSALAEKK